MPPRTKPPSPSPEPTSTTYPQGSQQGNPPMSGTFADILNTPMADVEAPKPIPAGAWQCVVEGVPEQIESSAKKTPGIRWKFKLLVPEGEVNGTPEEVQKSQGRGLTHDIYFSENNLDLSKHNLKQLILACGIDDDSGRKNMMECLSEAPGCQVIVDIQHEQTKPTDGSEPQILNRAKKFAKV